MNVHEVKTQHFFQWQSMDVSGFPWPISSRYDSMCKVNEMTCDCSSHHHNPRKKGLHLNEA